VRGDMYLADAAHTKGHTHPVTGACWHPEEKETVLTSASDGTLRTWDLEGPTALEGRLVCSSVMKLKNQRGVRVGATACAYEPDAVCCAGGAADGSVQLFSFGARSANRPDAVMRDAHGGSEVTGLEFSPNGRLLASRGDDDTVKVWDLRKTKAPLRTYTGVESFFSTSNAAWSPDSKTLVAGTSVRKGQGTGLLKFWDVDAEGTEPATVIGLAPGASVIRVVWHDKLNQILASTSTGTLRLLYDPLISRNGALLTASREPRRADPLDQLLRSKDATPLVGSIMNPHALPMYRDARFNKRSKKVRDAHIV